MISFMVMVKHNIDSTYMFFHPQSLEKSLVILDFWWWWPRAVNHSNHIWKWPQFGPISRLELLNDFGFPGKPRQINCFVPRATWTKWTHFPTLSYFHYLLLILINMLLWWKKGIVSLAHPIYNVRIVMTTEQDSVVNCLMCFLGRRLNYHGCSLGST